MMVLKGIVGTLGELYRFLLARRLWWIIPMVVLMLVFSFLIVLGSTGIGPFIYTLF